MIPTVERIVLKSAIAALAVILLGRFWRELGGRFRREPSRRQRGSKTGP
jgi:hypothetical protein